jgi:heptosyltransferase-2
MRKKIKLLLMYIAYFFYVIQRLTKKKTTIASCKKVLVINYQGIGDIVAFSPFLKTLQNSGKFDVWGNFPDYILGLQQEFVKLDGYIPNNNISETIKRIRQENFDLILIPCWALKHSFVALFSGAKAVLGPINEKSFKADYLNEFILEAIGLDIPGKVEIHKDLHLVERGNPLLDYLQLPVIQKKKLKIVQQQDLKQQIILHAGADYEGRQWSVDNFAKLIKVFKTKYSAYEIFLVGGKQDYKINERIIKLADYGENIAGKLSLIETQKLIANSSLFIGNDSGPMHISVFSGTNTIGLFGPNIPDICGPFSPQSSIIFKQVECSPCNQTYCPKSYKCMKLISVDDVITVIEDKKYLS